MTNHTIPFRWLAFLVGAILGTCAGCVGPADRYEDLATLEQDYRRLPMEARRLTGPLFWLHGDESPRLLRTYVEKVAEGGNGCFTAESRPHVDWLGPGWYRDLGICLEAAKRHDLELWIFDERWWPSGEVAGQVPPRHGSKFMEASSTDATGLAETTLDVDAERLIAVIAGRDTGDGIDRGSLVDLTGRVRDGRLVWSAPGDDWKVMVFTWRFSEGRHSGPLVDGASRDAVDWYVDTVYQPHFDHFGSDFGETIKGYFYDEPETHGDWGTEVIPMLEERGVDWKAALVAWKLQLAGEDQVAAKYQYQDAFAEAWGRTLYGGIERWCREHRVESIGHFLEHGLGYLNPRICAGNMFQLQKYSSLGGIDAVFDQFVMGERVARDHPTWQTPKLGSSISHAYGRRDDLAMVEIFGARGQDLTYREMKWWTDHMQVSGINFHIPHAFNPRSPHDRDCPPYFYNNGYEPRWPLYRVYADYTSRLSLMLSGGRHICPVAFLFLGNSYHVGEALPPEEMTTALQDALFDCDWLPYDVFEDDMRIRGSELRLRDERYRVLVVPAVEVIPHGTLVKIASFLDAGGVVIGYGMLPSKSATLGKTSEDVLAERKAIWGDVDQPSLDVCRTTAAGGRSYFLPAEPTIAQLRQVLIGDAGIHPTLEVLAGDTEGLLHVLHRVKAGRDVFFVCNQQHEGPAKRFELRAKARGVPERWDVVRDESTALPFRDVDDGRVELALTLEPLESALIVFQTDDRDLPARIDAGTRPARDALLVRRTSNPPPEPAPEEEESIFERAPWIWFSGDGADVLPCTRYFRGTLLVEPDREIAEASLDITVDNDYVLYLNGEEVDRGTGGYDDWRRARFVDLTKRLRPGTNHLAIAATNFGDGPNPAGVIVRHVVRYGDGTSTTGFADADWRATDREVDGWQLEELSDDAWPRAVEVGRYGASPWGRFAEGDTWATLSPVEPDPFVGRFTLPEEWIESGLRLVLEADGLDLGAAALELNGEYAGGFIGAPFRLVVTDRVRAGTNSVRIEPRAPTAVRIVAYR